MKNVIHDIVFSVLLGIDLYVMVTAPLVVAILAFVIGITYFTHHIFEFKNKLDAKKD